MESILLNIIIRSLFTVIMIMLYSLSARADPPLPAVLSKQCAPTEAAVFFGSRFHVKCSSPMQVGRYRDVDIYYFSLSSEESENISYALEIATTAIASEKRIMLWAKTSSTDNPRGCRNDNCRKLTGITLLD